ncbi:MAG: recombination-associated protein RdgC [Pseudomonadota bacterium]
MWFKNLRIYRLTKTIDLSAERLENALRPHAWTPCGAYEMSRYGWTSPLGRNGQMLTHVCAGFTMICARKQEKILPASAVKEALEERVYEIQASQGREVFRKEKRDLKDVILNELMPQALTRSFFIHAYFAPNQNLLIIDTASDAKAEEFLESLRGALGSLPVVPFACKSNATDVMTHWLQQHMPEGFEADGECELRDPLENTNVVRCKNQALESEEVLNHLNAGKQVIQIAVRWEDAIRCILTEDYVVRRLRFEDIVQEQSESDENDPAMQFDQDFAVMSLQLTTFIEALSEAFDGMEQNEEISAVTNQGIDNDTHQE